MMMMMTSVGGFVTDHFGIFHHFSVEIVYFIELKSYNFFNNFVLYPYYQKTRQLWCSFFSKRHFMCLPIIYKKSTKIHRAKFSFCKFAFTFVGRARVPGSALPRQSHTCSSFNRVTARNACVHTNRGNFKLGIVSIACVGVQRAIFCYW